MKEEMHQSEVLEVHKIQPEEAAAQGMKQSATRMAITMPVQELRLLELRL